LPEQSRPDPVAYGPGPQRFAGATYDPTSHYRAARVFGFFEEQGLTPALLQQSYRHQLELLACGFDALGAPDEVITRDRATPLSGFGGFLALGTPDASRLQTALRDRGVITDARGRFLRFGPAPYLSDVQLEAAIGTLGEVLRDVRRSSK
jgi:kynureninase